MKLPFGGWGGTVSLWLTLRVLVWRDPSVPMPSNPRRKCVVLAGLLRLPVAVFTLTACPLPCLVTYVYVNQKRKKNQNQMAAIQHTLVLYDPHNNAKNTGCPD